MGLKAMIILTQTRTMSSNKEILMNFSLMWIRFLGTYSDWHGKDSLLSRSPRTASCPKLFSARDAPLGEILCSEMK
jgi:hypothetical protein